MGREKTESETTQADAPRVNRDAAEKATQDNDLTTGHSDPDDGGADNAKQN